MDGLTIVATYCRQSRVTTKPDDVGSPAKGGRDLLCDTRREYPHALQQDRLRAGQSSRIWRAGAIRRWAGGSAWPDRGRARVVPPVVVTKPRRGGGDYSDGCGTPYVIRSRTGPDSRCVA